MLRQIKKSFVKMGEFKLIGRGSFFIAANILTICFSLFFVSNASVTSTTIGPNITTNNINFESATSTGSLVINGDMTIGSDSSDLVAIKAKLAQGLDANNFALDNVKEIMEARNAQSFDSVSSNTDGIQEALNDLPAEGGVVYLPAGTYTITSAITIPTKAQLVGSGWGTVIDVSSFHGTAATVITMDDYSELSRVKITGDIDPISTASNNVAVGNHSKVEWVWINNLSGGISCINKSDVHLSDIYATNIHDGNGWASSIHVSGASAQDIYINNVYISSADRGIEVEDGASNVYAVNGAMYNVYPTNGSEVYTFVLDAHSHADGGGVDNVVYKNFYLEGSGGPTAWGDSGAEADYVRNITFENITINNPWVSASHYACTNSYSKNVTFRNVKIYNINSTYVFSLYGAVDMLIDKLELANSATSNFQSNSSTNGLRVNNSTFYNKTVQFKSGKNITVDGLLYVNVDASQTGLNIDSSVNNMTIKNSTFIADASAPGNYLIRSTGNNIKIIGNNFLGSPVYYAVDVYGGSKGSISDNYVENNYIKLRSACSYFDVFNNYFAGTGSLVDEGGTGNVFYKNRGYVTENSGAVSVTSGNTYATVTHGLSVTPTSTSIMVTPTNNLGNATGWWVSDIGATTFRINVDTDPGADANFSWQVKNK